MTRDYIWNGQNGHIGPNDWLGIESYFVMGE